MRYLAGVFEQFKTKADAKDARSMVRGERVSYRPFTTDQRHLGRREVRDLMAWMRRQQLDPNTQTKYLAYLKNFLRVFKNHTLEEMAADGVRFPRGVKKPIKVLGLDELQNIFEALDHHPGWRGTVARGMIALYFATGVRPQGIAACPP